MSPYPNVERRDDGPLLTRDQADDAHWAQVDADRAAAYEHHINDACRSIQQTPFHLVDSAFIGQVLSTLGCKAQEAMLPEVAESIEILAMEVES